MKEHIPLFKGTGSKNKNIAREFGIVFAKSWFEDMLDTEMQGVLFSWDDIPNMVRVSLGMHYAKTPDNILELKELAYSVFEVEYSNLKTAYIKEHGPLPVRNDTLDDVIKSIVRVATNNHLMKSQSAFYAEKLNVNTSNLETVWKQLYIEEITVESLMESAIEKVNQLSDKKALDKESINNILSQVNLYYGSITNLADTLYSSNK